MENEHNSSFNNNKHHDSIAENLSRPTTHDAFLIGGPQSGLTANQYTSGNYTSGYYTGQNVVTGDQNIPVTQSSNLASNLNSGYNQTGLHTSFHHGTEGNAVFVPESKFNPNMGNIGMTQSQTVNTTTQMPIMNPMNTNTGILTEEHERPHGFVEKVKSVFKGDHRTEGSDNAPIETGEPEKKEGFFHKMTSHIPFIGHKDTNYTSTEPLGVLDESGTTVGMPGNVVSTSQLGLPLAGPDYTHGTHGITHDTVFTGGIHPVTVASTSLPMTERGAGITNTGPIYEQKPTFGVDYSGVNSTHVNRDITLQEGGLLGLRQGAVTGNPGDIITNFFDQDKGMTTYVEPPVIQQPVIMPTTTIVENTQNLEPQYVEAHTGRTIATGVGIGACSLLKPHEHNNMQ